MSSIKVWVSSTVLWNSKRYFQLIFSSSCLSIAAGCCQSDIQGGDLQWSGFEEQGATSKPFKNTFSVISMQSVLLVVSDFLIASWRRSASICSFFLRLNLKCVWNQSSAPVSIAKFKRNWWTQIILRARLCPSSGRKHHSYLEKREDLKQNQSMLP